MPPTPHPQYDSWDRPPDIILVVMHTCMLLMIYVCGYLIQNTFGVKKARLSKVESYLEVNT